MDDNHISKTLGTWTSQVTCEECVRPLIHTANGIISLRLLLAPTPDITKRVHLKEILKAHLCRCSMELITVSAAVFRTSNASGNRTNDMQPRVVSSPPTPTQIKRSINNMLLSDTVDRFYIPNFCTLLIPV